MNLNQKIDSLLLRLFISRCLAAFMLFLILLLHALPIFAQSPATASLAALRKGFLAPPQDARPMVRWWWFGPAVVKPEILRELQQMKASGIGGAELAFVYPEVLDDPAKDLKNLPFLSPEMLDAVSYAQREGRRLGLRIDVTLCSGWPYGGPNTTLREAATRLRTITVPVLAHATSVALPALEEGESIISASIANARTDGSPAKSDGGRTADLANMAWEPDTSRPLPSPGNIAPVNTTRAALFFISSPTKQEVKRASVGGEGWVLDPFSHEAVAHHLEKVGEPLLKAFGTTPPYAIFSDSLEAYGADWTPDLPAEFKKRRGYDLLPHLAELVSGGSPAAAMIRHDYGKTLTELVNENYLTQINRWAIDHHTKFRSQTYGEPAVSFSSQNLVGLAEGEGPQWRGWSTLRWATSANHVFQHNVTSGETFTWLHSPVFRATPLDMKAEADLDFIMGENQLIFHGWPYSPPQAEEPGWSLYAAAVFNDHNPWHPVMPAVTGYIARMSYLMRQGEPANQIAILLPTDDAWASFTPAHVTVSGAMQHLIPTRLIPAILSAGYNFDFIDSDAINRAGIHYEVLVIPPTYRIPLETLKRIKAFVASGGRVISIGHSPSIEANGEISRKITHLSKELFKPANLSFITDEEQLPEALRLVAKPDFNVTSKDAPAKEKLGFIRRKLPFADIYFVVNTGNQPVQATVNFATAHKFAEQWDPDSTASMPASATAESVRLAPYESRIFVFSDAASALTPASGADGLMHPLLDLSSDWKIDFTAAKKTIHETTLVDWRDFPAMQNYSGEAVYSRDFVLSARPVNPVFLQVDGGTPLPGSPDSPPEHAGLGPNGLPDPHITRTGPGMHANYDPPIHEAAKVLINGRSAGELWHPPYRLDVSKLLKQGHNHIEIYVFNTALNAWSASTPRDYRPLIARYGDRFQMQDLDRVKPLASGILGPIHLVIESRATKSVR